MEILQKVCLSLSIIGALNWGLIGLFNFNLVTFLFGDTMFTNIVYILVAISGIASIMLLFKHFEDETVAHA